MRIIAAGLALAAVHAQVLASCPPEQQTQSAEAHAALLQSLGRHEEALAALRPRAAGDDKVAMHSLLQAIAGAQAQAADQGAQAAREAEVAAQHRQLLDHARASRLAQQEQGQGRLLRERAMQGEIRHRALAGPADAPGAPGSELEQRLHHVHQAMEHLHAAGLQDRAEQLAPVVERLERAIAEEHAQRADAEREEARARRLRDSRPLSAETLEELKREIGALREELTALRRQLEEQRAQNGPGAR